jgi:hypothetical protein
MVGGQQMVLIGDKQVNVNDVWRTKEGHYVLIVNLPKEVSDQEIPLGMLWYDEIDNDFSVCQIYNRLETLVRMSPAEWFKWFGPNLKENEDGPQVV